jgi:hypothetical protein
MSTEPIQSTTNDRLSLDTILNLLAARRRRYVLYSLYLYANPMRLPDVAEQVTEWEHDAPGDELLEERLRAYNHLYHADIPKLANADVVAYSQAEDMVELGCNAVHLRPHLERTADDDLEMESLSIR